MKKSDFFDEHGKPTDKFFNVGISLCVFMIAVVLGVRTASMFNGKEKIEKIDYGTFLSLAEEGAIDTVYYGTDNEWMTVTLWNDESRGLSDEELENYIYPTSDKRQVLYPAYPEFRKDMLMYGVKLKVESHKLNLLAILGYFISSLPLFVFIYIFYRSYKNMAGGNVDEKSLIQHSDKKFSDVIGHDEVIEDLSFITDLIKDPSKGEKIGAKLPKGILMSGPPGTGKTLLAKAVAGEAGVPFLYMNASSFIEMFVGLGAKRVRDLFAVARKNTPCIVFIDEIDAIGGKRDSRNSNSENDQTINALLQEMDGFNDRSGIFVLAATNRPDKLDKALTRTGRFDREIHVNPPKDWHVRKDLFEHYLTKFAREDNLDTETLSRQTSGFTGSDIEAICNEASIIATKADREFITYSDLEEAIDKHVFKGNRTKSNKDDNDKCIVAHHEAGHAVMTYLSGLPIARASIIATTSGVGGVVFGADTDSQFLTNDEMLARIRVAYAGRASEAVNFDTVTTGAASDITQATEMIIKYIERYGFDESFGLLDMTVLAENNILSSDAITDRIASLSRKLYEETVELIKKNNNLVVALANALLDNETMTGDAVTNLLDFEKTKLVQK